MPNEQCVGCGSELLEIDKDPNGDENATCKRCVAEEDHDFDLDPGAVFNRSGERTDPQLERRVATTKLAAKPVRIMVDVNKLNKWAKLLESVDVQTHTVAVLEVSNEIKSLVAASTARQAKRKKK